LFSANQKQDSARNVYTGRYFYLFLQIHSFTYCPDFIIVRYYTKNYWNGTIRTDITGDNNMLWTIAVIFIILWLLGLISGYTLGNFIHILLIIAIIVVLVRIIQGRKIL
jgi:hypothetical protein